MIGIAEDKTLGRLFFTPADRANMEIIRKNSKAPDKVIKASDVAAEQTVIEDAPVAKTSLPVQLNGYITRSDGKNTVWVNDSPVAEKTGDHSVKIEKLNADNGQVRIFTDKKKAASLRPGQVYDPNTDKVYNNLRDIPRVESEKEPVTILNSVTKEVDNIRKRISDFIAPNSEVNNTSANP